MKQILLLIFVLFSVKIISAQELKKLDNVSIDSDNSTKATLAFNLDSLITECLADITADSIEHFMRELEGFGTRYSLEPNHRDIAVFLMNKFVSFGYTDVRLDSFVSISGFYYIDTTWQYNVVATLPGVANATTQYIAGGHYDSFVMDLMTQYTSAWVPGADDNASGTAATLEIARAMAVSNIQPPSTIIFICFAAEETGMDGSYHYAFEAKQNNDDIGFMINMDMISNNNNNDSLVAIFHYPESNYVFKVVSEECLNHTTLAVDERGIHTSDGFSFWQFGFETSYLQEYDFNTNYHSASDSVGNCNIPYCAEVAKITYASLLKASWTPRPLVHFMLSNSNNCRDAIAIWDQSKDQDVLLYNVYVGRKPNVFDTVFTIVDTTFLFDYLEIDSVYYIGVSAFNISGFESELSIDSVIPIECNFNEGILIVDGSDGGLNNPTDKDIDAFYDDVLFGFQRTNYSADSIGSIDLETLGRYSSVLWHVNSGTNTSSLRASETALKNYLSSGGNVFFALYRPLKCLEIDFSIGNVQYKEGSFAKDFLKLSSSEFSNTSYFNNANPLLLVFDTLHCDSAKTGGQMKYVESITPVSGAESIYWYDSPNSSLQATGELKYKSVGVLCDGADYKVVTLGFPLYFMEKEATQSMLHYVFETVFGETYTGIEQLEKDELISVFPNPVNDYLHVLGVDVNNVIITDLYGRVVLTSVCEDGKLYVGTLAPGVYCLRCGASSALFVKL